MESLEYCSLFNTLNENYNRSKILLACVYLRNEALIVDDEDNVYNIVNNAFKKLDKLCGKSVKDFAYSCSTQSGKFGYYILALTGDGRIYGWGRNTCNLVSLENEKEIIIPERLRIIFGPNKTVTRVKLSGCVFNCEPYERFTKISCALGHCMAVTSGNDIVLWGSNNHGQIGNGRKSVVEHAYKILKKENAEECSPLDCLICSLSPCLPCLLCLSCSRFFSRKRKMPITIIEKSNIRSIACGSFHSLVLFENGNVYGWGRNELGQLGVQPNEDHLYPRLIFSNIDEIVSVNSHTLALTKDRILYAMGENSYKQISNGDKIYYDVPIKSKIQFSKIATKFAMSMGLSFDGKCYIWGLYPGHVITEPTEVKCKSFAKIIAKCFSLTHNTIKIEERERTQKQERPVNRTVRDEDDENDLIDPSLLENNPSIIPIEKYNQSDDDVKKRNEITGLLTNLLELVKPTNIHIGDKINSKLGDGIIIPNGDFNVTGTNITGKSKKS